MSLFGPILFYIFINDLPDVLNSSDPFIFADDLKTLAVRKNFWQIQDDLDQVEIWVKGNTMELAMDKNAKITFRGQDRSYKLMDAKLDESKTVKGLDIYVAEYLTWKAYIDERLKIANKVLYTIRTNVAVNVETFIKLGLYKSLILLVMLYGILRASAS